MEISIEYLSYMKDEMTDLLTRHSEDVKEGHPISSFNPDWEQYISLESQGLHCMVVARDDGKLIGYLSLITGSDIHHKGEKISTIDAIYTDRDYREKSIGSDLVIYAETYSKEQGAYRLSITLHEHLPHNKLVEDLEFKCIERVFAKDLIEGEGHV